MGRGESKFTELIRFRTTADMKRRALKAAKLSSSDKDLSEISREALALWLAKFEAGEEIATSARKKK